MKVSVLILTLNEERNLGACLKSVSWSDDIVVLDSLSVDQTVAIARNWPNVQVIEKRLSDWSEHQNWAVRTIPFRHPWVLYLDADERCTRELADEIQALSAKDCRCAAFRLRRKDFFRGRWLRHAQLYPTWLVRLFRPECICYHRLVNPVAVVEGEVSALVGHLHHYPFSHGIGQWVERHNRYSDWEAQELLRGDRNPPAVRECLSRDPSRRRRCLKSLFARLPMRHVVKFFYYYILRRGFLDGSAGLCYATLQSFYEYLIICKTAELRDRAKFATPDRDAPGDGVGAP
jgi:glycosyltransferase involved in cell wall biosynthesis